jgi:hypothetical protein
MLSKVQCSKIEDVSGVESKSARRTKRGRGHYDNNNLVRTIVQNTGALTQPFPFLSLPWELRNEVSKDRAQLSDEC